MRVSRLRGVLALVLVLALVAAACGRDEDGDDAADTTTPEDTSGTDGDGEDEAAGPASADDCESYDGTQGVTDDSIKIGVSLPLSGVFAAAFSEIAVGYDAYFDYLNEQGGINGRRVEIIKKDDEYVSGNTISNYEELVQSDQVFGLFNVVGTANNLAIREQQNQQCVPNLYLATGSPLWGNPGTYPWTIGSIPSYAVEMAVFTDYLEANQPDAKVAVLYQNDDFGKAYLDSLKQLTEGTDIEVVAEEAYDPETPDTSSQVNSLAGSDADTLVAATTALACPNTMAAVSEADWDPTFYVSATCISATLMDLAEGANEGVISAVYLKDPTNPEWDDDEGMQQFQELGAEAGLSGEDLQSGFVVYGWTMAQLLEKTLEQTENLDRVEVMNTAWSLDDVELPLLLPDITVSTDGTDDPFPIESMKIGIYNGDFFDLQDELYTYEDESKDFSPTE